MEQTKYIFITGGVTSSLGKGIIAASLAKLLQSRGYAVTIQKLDPYINIDSGTLNPYEHGECYVTEDGAETDLDLGHYERYLNINLSQVNHITTDENYLNENFESIYEGDRRYKCDFCDKKFAFISLRGLHYLNVHDLDVYDESHLIHKRNFRKSLMK